METANVEYNEQEAMETSMKMMSIRPSSSISSVDSINEEEPRPPHEALFLALAYLPLFELLAMSVVCLSLRDAVNKDILPWLNIIVDRPLNRRLSDEILMKITSKANGRLTTLALINCVRITNAGLQRVIEKNPFIKKVCVSPFLCDFFFIFLLNLTAFIRFLGGYLFLFGRKNVHLILLKI